MMAKVSAKRVVIYLLGIICVSLGIVLCKKSNLGISPISSIPFVLETLVPLSFGMLTTLFHFVNTCLQMILKKTWKDPMLWLQFLLAFVFGWVIDLINALLRFNASALWLKVLCLVLSVFFTAFGMLLMLEMDLIQNPPDGTVKTIAALSGRETGSVKVLYDVASVVISVSIGLIFLHQPKGLGAATVVSAIFVGRTLTLLKKYIRL